MDRADDGEALAAQLFAGYLLKAFEEQRRYDRLPVEEHETSTRRRRKRQAAPHVAPHATIYDLGSDGEWERLHEAFAKDIPNNSKPWFRCLGLLMGMNAKTAIVEPYYVCLDYRSEFAAFHSNLNETRVGSTVRLHFFSQTVKPDEVTNLGKKAESYLGYIVVREGNLPLVGRTVLQVPKDYIQLHTAILEPVNFFGQRLVVRGVPFMQQDERFAVCAHVAAWVPHYTAFRRGMLERRLIADFVDDVVPMRPRVSVGLTDSQVAKLLDEAGFRTLTYSTPWERVPELPKIEDPKMAPELAAHLEEHQADNFKRRTPAQLTDLAVEYFRTWLSWLQHAKAAKDRGEQVVGKEPFPAIKGMDMLLAYLIRPYLRSGIPIYCRTMDHAVVICGQSIVGDRMIHFIHDDQNGPYLAADSLAAMSLDSLREQSGLYENLELGAMRDYPEGDEVERFVSNGKSHRETDSDRAIRTIIIPRPSRVLLPAVAAESQAFNTIEEWRTDSDLMNRIGNEKLRRRVERARYRTTIMMGIDYRSQRREQCARRGDRDGVRAFSSLQLSEWLVVVEGLNQRQALWEIAFDASSSHAQPRMLVGRLLTSMVTLMHRPIVEHEMVRLRYPAFPRLIPPSHYSKNRLATESVARASAV